MDIQKVLDDCCNTDCYCYAHGVCDFVAKEMNCPRIKSYMYNAKIETDGKGSKF